MAQPIDYINRRFQLPVDREIVLMLYRARNYIISDIENNRISSERIRRNCKTKHLHGGVEKPYGLRYIEGRLNHLVADGVIIMEKDVNPKKRTRPKHLFSISDKCRDEIETDMRIAEPELSYTVKASVNPPKHPRRPLSR
jgi:hypothetical protein